jgi:hypothetical protein
MRCERRRLAGEWCIDGRRQRQLDVAYGFIGEWERRLGMHWSRSYYRHYH